MATPGNNHQRALDCVFRYLRATADRHLVFQRGTPGGNTLQGFVDADWASDINDCKSTSGFVFTFGGVAISWSSKKQSSTALHQQTCKKLSGTCTRLHKLVQACTSLESL